MEAERGQLVTWDGEPFRVGDDERLRLKKIWVRACAVQFCPNFVCLGFSDTHCYVHMPADTRRRKDRDMG